jgi:Arc/MetJ-type ribon-helix-helix transcriptional regulator
MIKGMTRVKIAITIPEELLAGVKAAVARGEAASVSAYISDAVAMNGGKSGLRAYLDALMDEHGDPPPEAYAWADEQLRRMGWLPPEKQRASRSTRAR